MKVKKLRRNLFQRILGRQATPLPEVNDFWSFRDNVVEIDLAKVESLSRKFGAVRLEGSGLTKNLLVIHGGDDQYHAIHNSCSHGGRGLDPVPGTKTVQCCSMGTSTFDYQGNLISGSAQRGIDVFPVLKENGKLIILI